MSRRPTLRRREGRAGHHAVASVTLGCKTPGRWLWWVQSGHQEREKTWEARGVAGQLRPLLGGTGQCVGSVGLLQNRGVQAGKEGCAGVTVWTAVTVRPSLEPGQLVVSRPGKAGPDWGSGKRQLQDVTSLQVAKASARLGHWSSP